MFKQWQNYVTHFSEHIPVIKWCMTVIHYLSMGYCMPGFITGKPVNVMKMKENVLHRIPQVWSKLYDLGLCEGVNKAIWPRFV